MSFPNSLLIISLKVLIQKNLFKFHVVNISTLHMLISTLLVLYMVACNGWGIGIVLQVPRDSTNFAKKGKKSRVDHT
jgi:hypothetical protein